MPVNRMVRDSELRGNSLSRVTLRKQGNNRARCRSTLKNPKQALGLTTRNVFFHDLIPRGRASALAPQRLPQRDVRACE